MLQGTPQAIPPAQPIGGANALLVNRNNNVAFGAALLQVKGSLLARNCLLQPQQTTLANALRQAIALLLCRFPLLAYTPLKIKITAPIGNTSKLYMAAIARGSGAGAPPMYCGGEAIKMVGYKETYAIWDWYTMLHTTTHRQPLDKHRVIRHH